jgi:hypothetical protein
MALLDLLSAIGLTASAAIVVGMLVFAHPRETALRARIAIGFAAWFALLVVLTAGGVFQPQLGTGTAGLGLAVLLPMVVITLGVLRSPEYRRAVREIALPVLIAVHAVRILGLDFLLLDAAGRLPAPFPVAGWGDIFIGLTALPMAWAARHQIAGWRGLDVAWSLLGALDLIAAVGLGVASAPDSPVRIFYGPHDSALMTTLPWILIPGFLVPLLFLLHVAVLARLIARRAAVGP